MFQLWSYKPLKLILFTITFPVTIKRKSAIGNFTRALPRVLKGIELKDATSNAKSLPTHSVSSNSQQKDCFASEVCAGIMKLDHKGRDRHDVNPRTRETGRSFEGTSASRFPWAILAARAQKIRNSGKIAGARLNMNAGVSRGSGAAALPSPGESRSFCHRFPCVPTV